MNKLKEQTSLKAVKKTLRDNMVTMGYFNKAKVQVHKSKKAYKRVKQFKRIDDL